MEAYKLFSTVGGVNNQLDISRFSQRITFLSNFNSIEVVPYPHLNLVNLVGMAQKQQYLIWREKLGFFTALNRYGELLTWSLVTGKQLYKIPQSEDKPGSREKMRGYSIYRADVEDNTYVRNHYNQKNRSIQLLTYWQQGKYVRNSLLKRVEKQNKYDKIGSL